MVISDYIKKENIILKAKSSVRWDILGEMTDSLIRSGNINPTDRQSVLTALIDREKSMTTGIGNGVAIPHCISEFVSDILIVLAFIPKGIDFDSIDSVPVTIAVLLVVPKNKKALHIKTLAAIAKLMNNSGLRENIASMKSPEDIISEIAKYE